MSYETQLSQKSITAEKAAGLIESNQIVVYAGFLLEPMYIDTFIAKRVGNKEFSNVKLKSMCYPGLCLAAAADQNRECLVYDNAFFSPGDRILHDMGICDHIPSLFSEIPSYFDRERSDILYLRTAPMDKNGFFNFGIATTFIEKLIETADKVVIETNSTMPYCYGGLSEAVHINDVDFVVESDNAPILTTEPAPADETDKKIADLLLKEINDGACIQLGIGGMPNALGALIAKSGLRDLGVHTEMIVDSIVDMYEAGCITNKQKNVYRGKIVYTFGFGTQRLYDFMNMNPACAGYPVDLVNNPHIIAQNDNVVSINNALQADLYGQVASEASGFKHISGSGGQWDFVNGAYHSKGGKSFICMSSTFKDKEGNDHSRIVPYFAPGTPATVTRTMTQYVVTEFGMAYLKGKSTWDRAEELIKISHPDFQDELVKKAEEMNIWRPSNKKDSQAA